MSEINNFPAVQITPEMAPTIYVPNGLDGFLEQIRASVNEVPDLSTDKGRKRIASLASSVSRSKTAIEKPGREYLKRLKEAVKPAEVELKRFVDTCDAIRDEVRRPLTEWEQAEKERVDTLNNRLSALRSSADITDALGNLMPTAEISARLSVVKETVIDDSWQEITAEAGIAKDAAIKKLETALSQAEKRDAEAAELERLRLQQEEAARIQREDQIRREAEDRARRETEERARQELEAAARREAEATAAKDRAEREAREATERAEREKQQAIEAERRKAHEAEQQRIAAEKAKADEDARRAADKEHRRTINRKVIADLVAQGIPAEWAEKCLVAFASGKVTGQGIAY